MTRLPARVIAVDPGERVGWASGTVRDVRQGEQPWTAPWYGAGRYRLCDVSQGVADLKEFALWLASQQRVTASPPGSGRSYDVVVFETWVPHRKQGKMDWIEGDRLLSAQLVGMIRLTAWLSRATLKGYGPDRKHVFTASMPDDFKDRFKDSSEQHDQDALMHLWGYYFESWFDPTEEP